jgi:predicted hydrocarbon binding protein
MSVTTDLTTAGVVGVSRQGLQRLTSSLYRDLGGGAAGYLQDAGYNAGLYDVFARWLGEEGRTPESIPASEFGEWASRFFAAFGWGSVSIGALSDVATIDSPDWAEANPDSPMEYPACYFTAGALGELFGRLSDLPVAVMEVECRSMGAERCRFLVGGGETIQRVYDGVAQGIRYEETLGATSLS